VDIRLATGADWPAIWPIWHEVVASGETYTWDPDTDEATARSLWMPPPPAETWVAVKDQVIVGTALLKPNQPALGAHVANAGFMVGTAAAGHGIGRALAERIIARATELGYLSMQFNAVVAANRRAVKLWQSLGFDIIGTVPGAFRHAHEGLVDLHIMHRRLA
jgi:L-amino acid N-acyltransferase YncA